jgi:SAM-dependent methyltransferase
MQVAKFKRISWFKMRSFFENLRGIDTLRYVNLGELGPSENEGNRYEPSKKKLLHMAINEILPVNNHAIIDLGCGKGRALIEFSKYPFRKISGLEYSEEIIKICKKNLNILKIKNIELYCINAINFNDYEDYDYLYIFNTFPEMVFKKVIENITRIIEKNNKEIYIIYLNPVCHSLIMNSGCFRLIKKIENENKIFPHTDDIYIYKSITEPTDYSSIVNSDV